MTNACIASEFTTRTSCLCNVDALPVAALQHLACLRLYTAALMAIAAGVEGQQQESRLPTPALAPAEPAGALTR